jgi:excisionase family DNA binding protein
MQDNELITVHEAAERLGTSARHVLDLVEAGTIEGVPTGRTVLIRLPESHRS